MEASAFVAGHFGASSSSPARRGPGDVGRMSGFSERAHGFATPHTARLAVVARRVRERVESGRSNLPMLSDTARELLRLAGQPDLPMHRLVEVIEGDPMIAGRVVAIANSPLYSTRGTTNSVRAASLRLGVTLLRELFAQAVADAHVFAGSDAAVSRSERDHAAMVACLARKAASLGVATPDDAYFCGLMHDIGRPVVYQLLREELSDSVDANTRELLTDMLHTTVGEHVARLWGLPDAVIEVVRGHHAPDILETTPSPRRLDMVSVVAIVDRLAHFMVAPRDVDYHGVPDERHWQVAVERLGLSATDGHAFVVYAERIRDGLGPRAEVSVDEISAAQ